jgi:hypothetical protein
MPKASFPLLTAFILFIHKYSIVKFFSDFWQVSEFSPGTSVSSTNKTDRHDIPEILLKVVLNTIILTPQIIHHILVFN